MNELLICSKCPCHHEVACIQAAYRNGPDFGDKIRHAIADSKKNQLNKEARDVYGKEFIKT
jgi:hypothetical protein